MSALVPGIEIMEVSALFAEYAKLSHSYSNEDNPLHRLTQIVSAKAIYYTVVPINRVMVAEKMMKRVAGRRKLRYAQVDKDEIRHPIFAPTREVMVMFA